MRALRANLPAPEPRPTGSQCDFAVFTFCTCPSPSVPTGCSITEAVTILGNKLRDYQRQFSTTHLLALCDYFHNTFIRHYKLYQYVLGQDQEVNLTVAHLEVCAPPQPLPLAEGTDRETWKHEQQVAELRMAEVQKRTNVLLLKETLRLEQAHLLQKAFGGEVAPIEPPQTLRREVRLPRHTHSIPRGHGQAGLKPAGTWCLLQAVPAGAATPPCRAATVSPFG